MHVSHRSRPAQLLTVLALASACSVAATSPALAATTDTAARTSATAHAGGWQRYYAQDFDSAAGALCSFAFSSKVLFDRQYVRTTSTFSDGTPRTQQFVGPLVVELTNVATGHSIRRNLSGRAVVNYRADGSFTFELNGPAAVGFRTGDSLPAGYYLLRGVHEVVFSATGSRALTVDRGSEENLCAAMSVSSAT